MKYYILSNSADKKEVGHYIQTTMGEVPSENGEYDKSARSNLSSESFPNFDPNLDFELEKKAKLTDVVSASNISSKGFLLNEKTRKILSQFNVINHKYYNAHLKVKDKTFKYFWLHLVNNSFEGIDFKKSIFCEADLIGNKIQEVEIRSEADYYNKNALCEDLNSIIADKIVFTEKLSSQNLDLYFFPQLHSHLIASENLINSIRQNNITGLKYKEAMFI